MIFKREAPKPEGLSLEIGDHSYTFATPAEFEFALTGRHLTLRADGDSVENAAFGGPLVYGHGQSNPTAR